MISLLLIFASFLRLPMPGSAADPLACSPRTCGDLNIAYPFWLEEAGQPPCGPPSFQLNCNGSHALLSRSMLGGYEVLQIFAENSSFLAVNHNLGLIDGCPKWWLNISLGLGLSPFVISTKNREMLVLFNCTRQQQVTPQGFLRTPCRNESFHLGGEYGSHREQGGLPPSCHLAVVPVLGSANGSNYIGSMRQGFLLEWTVESGDCTECVASGGQCRYANDGTGFYCNCSDGDRPDKCGRAMLFFFLVIVCRMLEMMHAVADGECSPEPCGNLTISSPFGVTSGPRENRCTEFSVQVHYSTDGVPYLGYYDRRYRLQILKIFYGNHSLLVSDVDKL